MLNYYSHKSSRGSENEPQTRYYVRFDLFTTLLMPNYRIARRADWQIFIEFSEADIAFIVRVQQSRKIPGVLDPSPELLDTENEGSELFRNVGEY